MKQVELVIVGKHREILQTRGYAVGDFAVHHTLHIDGTIGKNWTLTHLPTGHRLFDGFSKCKQAYRIAKELAKLALPELNTYPDGLVIEDATFWEWFEIAKPVLDIAIRDYGKWYKWDAQPNPGNGTDANGIPFATP